MVLSMNRLVVLVLISLSALQLQAQTAQAQSSTITISTTPSGARFAVDGAVYSQAANFNWPAGSEHVLVFITDPPLPGQAANTSIQTSPDGGTIYSFSGWNDNAGLLIPKSDPVQIITADPHVTSINAQLTVSYKVLLKFLDPPNNLAPVCGGAPGFVPAGELRPGIVYVGQGCYWASAVIFVQAGGQLTLNAFPFPGFVFLGWVMNFDSPTYLQSITVKGPMTIAPFFSPAKRVQFVTNPPGLQVTVDHTTVPTRSNPDTSVACTERQPVSNLTFFPPLCFGDFDFAPDSVHTVTGLTPQLDIGAKWWVYDAWKSVNALQKGSGPASNYSVDENVSTPDTVTVSYIAGAHVGFLTSPSGLKLTVDGRPNFPSYDFIWGIGSTHTVTAPATQYDKGGRQYTFRAWSNGGDPSQSVVVDQAAVDNGMLITATYNVLSRVIVQSSPTGQVVQVDGASCTTPCTVDRTNGTKLHITAPASIPLGDSARLDLLNWSDGGAADHTYTVNGDFTTVTAMYRSSYRLAASSNPSNGANFVFDPVSPDMFYPQDTQVTINASANGGFKFVHWGGDLTGSYPAGVLTMSVPHSIIAQLSRVPYIAPAGVRNAVGDTPGSAVAAGSLITIYGQSLAPTTEVGRVNPLAQAIAGVTVTVNDRILPLIYVSPEQINAQVPSDLPAGDYILQVHSQGQPDVSATFSVVRDAPGLFTQTLDSQTYAMAFHADGSVVTPDNPAKAGETVSLFGTGFGPYNGVVVDGFFPPVPPPTLMDSVSISAGDQSPTAAFVGAAPGYSGVTLMKFKIPDGMPGETTVPVSVTVNGASSNTVMLPLQ